MSKYGLLLSDNHILADKIVQFIFHVGRRTFESAGVLSSKLSAVTLKRNKLFAIEKRLLFSFEMSKTD